MNIEIAKELHVLSRRMEVLLKADSDFANDVFDNGTEDEVEALQDILMQEYADVLDRDAFLDALHAAYVEEGRPMALGDSVRQ